MRALGVHTSFKHLGLVALGRRSVQEVWQLPRLVKLSIYILPPHTQTLLVHTISLLNEAPAGTRSSTSSGGSARLSAFTAAASANAMHMFGLVVTAMAQQGSSSSDMAALFDMPPSLPVPAGLMHPGEGSGGGGGQGITQVCLLIAN